MKTFYIAALAISCGLVGPVNAQMHEINRYDKSIEKAAAKRAGEKIGSLRGLILADSKSNFVTRDDLIEKPKESVMFEPSAHRKAWQPEPGTKALPPMVMLEKVDPFVTGRVGKFDGQKFDSQKFDSLGNPMNNHQDYPRPTPLSVAKSLLDAMTINPYPGDS